MQIAQHGLQSIGERLRLLLGQGLQADLNQRSLFWSLFLLRSHCLISPCSLRWAVITGCTIQLRWPSWSLIFKMVESIEKRHVVGNDFNHHIAGRKSRFGVLLQAAERAWPRCRGSPAK